MKKLISSFLAFALGFVMVGKVAANDFPVTDSTTLITASTTAISGDTITFANDFSVGHRVDFNNDGVVINGAGHTLNANFAKTDNSNNAALGIFGDNITVNSLVVDGTGGTSLHCINSYTAQNLLLNSVTLQNCQNAGLVVNGSTVTVNNVTTTGNGWGGINVDLGSGVADPATLTVNGISHHNETAHIWIDDKTKNVSVVDTNNQYNYTDTLNFRVYTLKPIVRAALINTPTDGADVTGVVNFDAVLIDDDVDSVQWAVRQGTCLAGVGTVYGNVDGHNDVATIDSSLVTNQTFHFSVDVSTLTNGPYCFVYNPIEDAGESDIRLTRNFNVANVLDQDQDGVADSIDNCPTVANASQLDTDNDGIGDVCDPFNSLPPTSKDQCKKDGWKTFDNPKFKNQGACVSYVEHHNEHSDDDDHDDDHKKDLEKWRREALEHLRKVLAELKKHKRS